MLAACKKEGGNSTEPPTINSKDPVALSKALKIWHATRQAGAAPAPRGGAAAPMVEAPSTPIQAFNGQFAIVKPALLSGSVAGYYVGIAGAGEYFKLDYSKPRIAERPNGLRPKNFLQRPLTGDDSSIVVVIPSNLIVPDTFCITYCPYDSLGNIGQPVTTCIYVSQLGGDAASSWIQGTWRVVSATDDNGTTSDTVIYNRWTANDTRYYCYDDQQNPPSIVSYYDSLFPAYYTDLNLSDSTYQFLSDISFGATGGMVYIDSSITKSIDYFSGCAAPTYNINQQEGAYRVTGGWSVTGNTLTLVYLFDELGNEDYNASSYTVLRPDDNTLVLQAQDGSNERVTLRRQ